MSVRLRAVIIAITFGLVATIGVALYINSFKAAIVESGQKQAVYVANAKLASGSRISQALDANNLKKMEIPKRYVAEDAVTDPEAYKSRMLTASMSRGEQLTLSKLRSSSQSEVTYKLPADYLAVSIPVDDVVGVGGRIKVGDRVAIIATFEPGPDGADVSRMVLSGIEVLALSGQSKAGGMGAQSSKPTLTLAVTPADAEKLVFAEEKGKVWVALQAPATQGLPQAGGQTVQTVFR